MLSVKTSLLLILLGSCTNPNFKFGESKESVDLDGRLDPTFQAPLQMGDSSWVYSTMLDLFGQNADSSNILRDLVLCQSEHFGGGSIRQYSSRTAQSSYEFKDGNCPWSGKQSSNTGRSGLTIKVCEKIVNTQPESVVYLLSSAGIKQTDSFDEQKIHRLFKRFYPLSTMEQELLGVFKKMASEFEDNPQEYWNYAVLTLCSDTQWQVF